MKKRILPLGSIVIVLVVVIGLFVFGQNKNSYHGIHITFEDDTPAEYIEDLINRYDPDESYNSFPRYVRLTYFHKSERQVKELARQIMDEEYVIVANHVLVATTALLTTDMTVAVDPSTVEKIDIYWNYQPYCIERGDDPAEIEALIDFINGEYTVVENIVNTGTGSGNEITIYDSKGNELFWFSVWELEDGTFSLGNADYKFTKTDAWVDIDSFIELLPA